MSKDFRNVKLITANGKYISHVFTGIDRPTSEWKLIYTNQKSIAMVCRIGEPLLAMLEVIFPDIKFDTEIYSKYQPCRCELCR